MTQKIIGFDRIWAIGMAASNSKANDPNQWCVHNLLGFALVEVREHLKTGQVI